MRLANRRGFALPMAIFVIALLTVSLAASFLAAGSERRIVDSQEAQVRAYNIAQSGLERYMAERTTLLSVSGEPGTTELSGTFTNTLGVTSTVTKDLKIPLYANSPDSAIVRVYKLRPSQGSIGTSGYINSLYAVRAAAKEKTARITGVSAAERSVGQLAIWVPGQLSVLAGWTSLSGLRKNGSAGTLSGTDHCGKNSTLAGLAVPTGGFSGNSDAISGNPAIKELGTQDQTNQAVKIDWNAIKNNNAIPADYVNQWPPSTKYVDPNFWPIVHFTGDAVLQSGRGMLIVDGNLSMDGNVTWDGIMLIGGNITSNGNNTVYGAVITGLDEKLGEDVISNEIGNGTKIYQYDSCNVEKATASMGTMRPLNNTWADNWKSY